MIATVNLHRAVIAAALLLAPVAAGARAYDIGDLHIGHPWVKAPPNGAPTAAGYLTVTNHGKMADRLLGGSTAAAKAIEPHTMSMAGGVMRMRFAPDGLVIAPGATVTLAPGGDHLMLIAPRRALKAGDEVNATLNFAHAGSVKVHFDVRVDAPGD